MQIGAWGVGRASDYPRISLAKARRITEKPAGWGLGWRWWVRMAVEGGLFGVILEPVEAACVGEVFD